jgi:phage tail-like protein
MRFHVSIDDINPNGYLTGGTRKVDLLAAGFTSCSLPEISIEPVTYREGNFVYERKFAGFPTVSDVTLQRGVARGDSSFWLWAGVAAEGGGENGNYRENVRIDHFHREQALSGGPTIEQRAQGVALQTFSLGSDGPQPARRYRCFESFPIRHKVAGDLDATASEISIMELDFAMEYFTVQEVVV